MRIIWIVLALLAFAVPAASQTNVVTFDGIPQPVTISGSVPVSGTVTANQGTAASTSDGNAWPIKVVFGGVHIDPRLVTATQSGVWTVRVFDQSGTGINSTSNALWTFPKNTAVADATATRCVNAAGTMFVECGIGGAGSTDTDDGSIAGGQVVGLGAALSNIWSGAAWVRLTQGQATMAASVPVAIASNQTAIPVNTNDGAGNAIASSIGSPALTDRGLTVRPAFAFREPSAVVLDTLNETVELELAGYLVGSFVVTASTLNGTIAFEEFDGTNWATSSAFLYDPTSDTIVGPRNDDLAVLTTVQYLFLNGHGASRIRLRLSVFTSGAATIQPRAGITTAVRLAFGERAAIGSVAVQPRLALQVGGFNPAANTYDGVNTRTGTPAASDVGLVVRPFMGTNGTQVMPTMDAAVRRGFVQLTNGTASNSMTGTSIDVNCTGGCGSAAASNHLSISVNESVAAPVAATLYVKRRWTPPANAVFVPSRVMSVVTTAASRSYVGAGQVLGTWNENTNAFTDGAAVVAPRHYARLFAVVTTARAATANTITVTYTDENGTAGNAATCTMPATALGVGLVIECVLAVTVGQERDAGVRDITAVADSAAPATGIVALWGLSTLHDTFGVANAYEETTYDQAQLVANAESILIMLMQAAVTAQQRGVTVTGSIR